MRSDDFLRSLNGGEHERERGLVVRDADLSLARPPAWVWADRIALGMLNLIVGQEGAGKGTLACWLFAKLSRGQLPGDLSGTPATVAVVGDEDAWEGVWTPRLHVAGADLTRIKLIERPDAGLIDLAAERDRIAAKVREHEVRLLYLDALVDNLGATVDDWRGKQVREALAPARQLARDLNCAVLGSLHPNKSGASFRQLMSGSAQFNALSRSSLLLAEHPEDPERRVLTRAKGNLSKTPEAVEFVIESVKFEANGYTFNTPRATDFTTSALTTDDLLSKPTTVGDARTDAREMVGDALADGEWHPAGPIIAACEEKGVYKRAVHRAADDLGVERDRRGYPARAHWRSRDTSRDTRAPVMTVATVTSEDLPWEGCCDSHDKDDSDTTVTSGVTTGGDLDHLTDKVPR